MSDDQNPRWEPPGFWIMLCSFHSCSSETGLQDSSCNTQGHRNAFARQQSTACHFLQHRLCTLGIFQVISLTTVHLQLCPGFHQRKVSHKMRSHTVTLCLVWDHQASASGSCAVSTKTELIVKSKGDSNDVLESTKLFLKQNAPWWTCDVMSRALALWLFRMTCHLWMLQITELPGLKEVISFQSAKSSLLTGLYGMPCTANKHTAAS